MIRRYRFLVGTACAIASVACENQQPSDFTSDEARVALQSTAESGANRAGEGLARSDRQDDPGPVLTGGDALQAAAARAGITDDADGEADNNGSSTMGTAGLGLDSLPEFTQDELFAMAQRSAASPQFRPGEDPCQQAWESFERSTRDMAEQREVPHQATDRARFLEGCNAASPSLRQCLSPAYARSHPDECLRAAETRADAITTPPPGLGLPQPSEGDNDEAPDEDNQPPNSGRDTASPAGPRRLGP